MKHYINPQGQLFAYESDGSQDHVIPEDQRPATTAEVLAIQKPSLTARQLIIGQIADLEVSVTPRRLREATLTDAGKAWLATVDTQIALLRAQLT